MNIGYMIYEAERPKTAAERRADALRAGEFAKAVSRLLRGRGETGRGPSVRPTLALVKDTTVSTAGPKPAPCPCEARTAS